MALDDSVTGLGTRQWPGTLAPETKPVFQPRKRRHVLLTGFGPFPSVDVNASADYARRLSGIVERHIPNTRTTCLELPTAWRLVAPLADRLATTPAIDVAIHFGVHARSRTFLIEAQACNNAGPLQDILGETPPEETLVEGAPFSLSAGAMAIHGALRLAEKRLPVGLSEDAGRYLCNALYYHALWRRYQSGQTYPVLFVHLPIDLGMPGAMAMPTALVCGLELVSACLQPNSVAVLAAAGV
jgi:pyroglutamyl-peptidase